MPEATGTPARKVGRPPHAAYFLLVAVAWIAHLLLRQSYEPGHPLRLAVSAALAACVALLLWAQVRVMRSRDEYNRTVNGVALAIAFPASIVAALAYGLAYSEEILTHTDPHDLPAIMLAIWAASLAITWRRYG